MRLVPLRANSDLIERALAQADINAVRLALYQLTNDPSLAAMEVLRTPV